MLMYAMVGQRNKFMANIDEERMELFFIMDKEVQASVFQKTEHKFKKLLELVKTV